MLRWLANKLGLTNSARFARFIARDRAAHPDEFARADEVLAAFHSGGGLAWSMQPYKLVALERLVNALRPASILELGSGSSTLVFARYARQSGATFTTVDESEEWMANTAAMLARFGVGDAVQTVVQPKRVDFERREANYPGLPALAVDMLMIDGPALELNGQKALDAVCTDVFSLPRPKWIVVDMRAPTVARIARDLSAEYSQRPSDVLARRPRMAFDYFTVFERR